jgi:hypothetical protein
VSIFFPFLFSTFFSSEGGLLIYYPVGRPVFPKTQMHEPRDDDVDELQERYMAELRRLWDTHKDEYARDRTPGPEGELRFVG